MAELTDINVDELRRRARRRLVGAIVLALAAAVVVPMLLESDPKPLGDDVSIKIPPVDDGKFVNRLSDNKGKSDAPPSPADTAPRKSVADAEKAVMSPATKVPKYDTAIVSEKATTAPPSPSAPAPGTGASAPPTAAAPDAAAASSDAKSADAKSPSPATSVTAAATKTETSRDGFAVQLAAFSDDKGANALANRLKKAGYPAYTEPLSTSRGTLWRVRVGPYSSRDAAGGVRDKLKAEGQSGIVAPAH
jgi:DedD protein